MLVQVKLIQKPSRKNVVKMLNAHNQELIHLFVGSVTDFAMRLP